MKSMSVEKYICQPNETWNFQSSLNRVEWKMKFQILEKILFVNILTIGQNMLFRTFEIKSKSILQTTSLMNIRKDPL